MQIKGYHKDTTNNVLLIVKTTPYRGGFILNNFIKTSHEAKFLVLFQQSLLAVL